MPRRRLEVLGQTASAAGDRERRIASLWVVGFCQDILASPRITKPIARQSSKTQSVPNPSAGLTVVAATSLSSPLDDRGTNLDQRRNANSQTSTETTDHPGRPNPVRPSRNWPHQSGMG